MTTQNQTEIKRIRNLSALTDKQLRDRITQAGIEIPKGTRRSGLIGLCRDHGLWGEHGNVVPLKHKAKYGAKQNCGDEVAEALASYVRVPHPQRPGDTIIDPALLESVAEQNGVSLKRWQHLNIGMVRMNLGNVLRGKIKRGDTVHVGPNTFEAPEESEVLE